MNVMLNSTKRLAALLLTTAGCIAAMLLYNREANRNEALEQRISESLPEINKLLPAYAQINHIEFMPEDFERTPKRSIKRYLYQRQK